MESNLKSLSLGFIAGVLVTIAVDPFYQKAADLYDLCIDKTKGMMDKTQSSITKFKESFNRETDEALEMLEAKIEDIVQDIDAIDLTKVKSKSKVALEAIKQKIISLKQ